MLDALFVATLVLIAAGIGQGLLRWLDADVEHPLDSVGLSTTLGLGLLSLATLGLGELGFLSQGPLAILLIVGSAVAAWELRGLGSRIYVASPLAHTKPTAADLLFLGPLILAVAGTLLSSFTPVTDGDALCYHLHVPKVFLSRGAVFFDPDLHETVYPLLTEMLYATALTFRGPVACRLISWAFGIAFALNVTALARPSLGARAWWAGTVALLVPAVTNGMSAPLNDVSLAAFGTSALVCWSRFHDRPGIRTAVLAGVAAGMSLGVKYPALILTALIGLAIAARPLIGHRPPGSRLDSSPRAFRILRERVSLAAPVVFGLSALLVGGSWYARAWIHTGNPVYPFFRTVFAGSGLDEVLDPIKRPLPVNAWNLFTSLVPLTLEPQRFDSFSHQFGPAFLLFLPALFLERAPRRVLGITAIGYLFLMICLTQRQSMRFLLIAIGPMAVAVAWLADSWRRQGSPPKRLLVGILAAVLGFEAAVAAGRARHGMTVVAGRESAEQYLLRREPTYRVGRWVGEHLPREAHLVGQDHRGYYFPCDYTMELAHRRRTGLGRSGEPAGAVVARLRESGFTHVLLCPPEPESAVEFDPTLGRLLSPWLHDRRPLYQESITDGDGVTRRYAIYSLPDLAAAGPARSVRQ